MPNSKPDGVGGATADALGSQDGARRVVNGPWPSELNIGQNVNGNVHGNFFFNVGERIPTLTELSDAQVDHFRATALKAISHRQWKLDSASVCFGVMLLTAWSQMPAEMMRLPPSATPLMQMAASIAVTLGFFGGFYCTYSLKFRAWSRRHKATIRELESILAKLEAERDMRKPNPESQLVEIVRKLMSALRE